MNINKELLRTLLKELCEINGASGREENVREYILDKICLLYTSDAADE